MIELPTLAFLMTILPIRVRAQQKPNKDVSFQKAYADNIGFVQFVIGKFRISPQESDELVQDVFLRFHQNMERVDPGKVRAYLATTARNLAIDSLRRDKKQKTHGMEVGEDHRSDAGLWKDDPRRLIEAEAASEFLQEIKNEPGAETFLLFYRDGLSVKEIAERLGESTGTITSRLTRTRQKFKERLQNHLDKLLVLE